MRDANSLKRRAHSRASLAAIVVAVVPACSVMATNYAWNNSANSSYGVSGNWSPAGVPGSSDSIITPLQFGAILINTTTPRQVTNWTFNATSNYDIVSQTSSTGGAMTITGNLDKSGTGTLTFRGSSGNLMDMSLGSVALSGGLLKLGGSSTQYLTALTMGSATLTNTGGLILNVGATTGTATITGQLSMSDTSTVNLRNQGASSNTSQVGTLSLGSLSSSATTPIIRVNSNTAANPGSGVLVMNNPAGTSTTYAGTIVNGNTNNIMSLTMNGAGTQILTGTDTYTGTTTLRAGALQANDAKGLPTTSFLSLDGGVLQSNGTASFTRLLSTSGTSKFQFTANGGGFSANGGQLTVNLGGAQAEQTWGSTVGSNIVGTLKFGSTSANARTLFRNAIDLAGADRTVNVTAGAGGDSAEISGNIRTSSGTAGLIKTGSGLLILSGTNSYNGPTTVSGGTLQAASGSALGSGPMTVGSGTFTINSGVTVSNPITLNGAGATLRVDGTTQTGALSLQAGTLAGTGTLHQAVTIGTGLNLAPGDSPGTLTVTDADETWAPGGVYQWQFLNNSLIAGTGWDLTSITGSGKLAITATSGSKFTLALQTLSGINPDTTGTPLNFDNSIVHQWLIASSANAISGWNPNAFTIDSSAFHGAALNGSFSLSRQNNDVYLVYSIPEPTAMTFLGLIGLGCLMRRRGDAEPEPA